jgi:hypothetical protein
MYILQSENLKNRLLGRPRHRWNDNTKLNIKKQDLYASVYGPVPASCDDGNKFTSSKSDEYLTSGMTFGF